MRAILLTAAAAISPATLTLVHRAEAAMLAATSTLRAAAADTALQRQAAVVCSFNGCAQVHTARARHQPRP